MQLLRARAAPTDPINLEHDGGHLVKQVEVLVVQRNHLAQTGEQHGSFESQSHRAHGAELAGAHRHEVCRCGEEVVDDVAPEDHELLAPRPAHVRAARPVLDAAVEEVGGGGAEGNFHRRGVHGVHVRRLVKVREEEPKSRDDRAGVVDEGAQQPAHVGLFGRGQGAVCQQ
jgi:hypothetical protein